MAKMEYPSLTDAKDHFFLLVVPLDQNASLLPQRLRFHSSDNPIFVLTDDAPKFIRFHSQASIDGKTHDNILVATSWDSRHTDRWWGVTLDHADSLTAKPQGWEEVQMLEGKICSGFQWIATAENESDELVYDEPSNANSTSNWAGWTVREGDLGKKQLYWIISSLVDDLPTDCERVKIIRERVWGQPDTPKTPNDKPS